VMVTAANHVTRQPIDEADVVIGRDVWLGARVIVLPGVRIGYGEIVSAGALVIKSVPSGAIVGGQPARVIVHRAPVFLGAFSESAGAAAASRANLSFASTGLAPLARRGRATSLNCETEARTQILL